MIIDTAQLVNAVEAARLCGMGKRNFYHLYPKEEAVPLPGQMMFHKKKVVEWNRQRIAGLERKWKRHAAWEESCSKGSPPAAKAQKRSRKPAPTPPRRATLGRNAPSEQVAQATP